MRNSLKDGRGSEPKAAKRSAPSGPRERDDATHAWRLAKAATFVMAVLLVVPGIEALLDEAGVTGAGEAAYAVIDSRLLTSASDPFGALEQIEQLADVRRETPPEELSGEIPVPQEARDARFDSESLLLGYVLDCEQDEAVMQVEACMEQVGWRAVRLGGIAGTTFVKEDGTLRWALATCTQVGESTSVVVRC